MSWRRFWSGAAVAHLLFVAILLALFRFVGERSPLVAILLYAPRLAYGFPLIATVPALARRGAFLTLPLATAALILGPLMGLQLHLPRAGKPSIRVLTYNVWFGYRDPEAIAREVREAAPDVVVFEAAAHAADIALQRPPFAGFHYLHQGSFVVASRFPMRLVAEGRIVSARVGAPWVRFAVDSPLGTLDLFAVHPHSPRSVFDQARHGRLRALDPERAFPFLDKQLGEIDAAVREAGPLRVVAGDFNVPGGSALLAGRFAGTEDAFASAGNGFGYTFPCGKRVVPWMRLDRVLLGPALAATSARVVGGAGSDHRPLVVEIAARSSE